MITPTRVDRSYGVIPYRIEDGELRFLVIYQYSSLRDDIYWIFPKGHAEEKESPEEAATRELKEETQLEVATLHTDHPLVLTYDFEHDGVLVKKSVTFFLGKVRSANVILQEEEVKDAGWFSYEAARERLSYESSKRILDQAAAYLRNTETIDK